MTSQGDESHHAVLRQIRAAEGYCQLRMWEEAWNELDELPPEERARVPIVILRLEILVAMQRYESAAVLAQSLIAKGIHEKQAYLLGAYALRRSQTVEEAERLLLSGEDVLTGDVLFHYNLACYASVLGKIEDAKRRLREAFAIDPSSRVDALDDEDLEPVWASMKPIG